MKILITGGAGFIGINAALHFLNKGSDVIIFDNFSRKGSKDNISWIKRIAKKPPKVHEGDIRNFKEVKKVVKDIDVLLHFAGQVAVTSSVENPRDDFENNALGTLNVLEAVRLSGKNPIFIYSSTNKVYGSLEHLKIKEDKTRYAFVDRKFGVSEEENLDFHSPYGCSKGAADQYVRDYHRIYGLNTIVFRQSCIYGPRQFGIEDQGWIAWFIIAVMLGKKISIYGNGKQVRDLLYIDDLMRAYDLAIKDIGKTKGKIYNIGGGSKNTISVWLELQPLLEKYFNKKIISSFSEIRPGDQPIFIADIRKAEKEFGWAPKVNVKDGVRLLYEWVEENKELFKS